MEKKIILKDGEDELLPKTSADMVFTSEGNKVEDELGEKLTDAPNDGKQYARKNGAWAEVEEQDLSQYMKATDAQNTFQPKGNYVTSAEVSAIKKLTQSAYDSLETKDSKTVYLIVG